MTPPLPHVKTDLADPRRRYGATARGGHRPGRTREAARHRAGDLERPALRHRATADRVPRITPGSRGIRRRSRRCRLISRVALLRRGNNSHGASGAGGKASERCNDVVGRVSGRWWRIGHEHHPRWWVIGVLQPGGRGEPQPAAGFLHDRPPGGLFHRVMPLAERANIVDVGLPTQSPVLPMIPVAIPSGASTAGEPAPDIPRNQIPLLLRRHEPPVHRQHGPGDGVEEHPIEARNVARKDLRRFGVHRALPVQLRPTGRGSCERGGRHRHLHVRSDRPQPTLNHGRVNRR